MALDLSALEEKPVLFSNSVSDGKAMRLKLTDIEPDPNQPRTEKKPEEIAEIGQNIKERSVRLPISVKAHPTKIGKWIINDGELRYLGSKWAKVEDIPVVVDEDFDDFDQVNVNEKRFNLRPMELARFIQKKLKEGFKKGDIAARLGKPGSFISEVLALIDAPVYVRAVYDDGRCTSPKTIYDLCVLAEKFPEQVQDWCKSKDEVTRRSVAELRNTLKGEKKESTPMPLADSEKSKLPHETVVFSGETEDSAIFCNSEGVQQKQDKNDMKTTGSYEKALVDPNVIKKPLLLVEYNGRSAAVLLNQKPSTPGLLHIRYEDGSGDDEVDAGRCKINMLAEG